MKRKQAQKIEKHFMKILDRIQCSAPHTNMIALNVARAKSFAKALKLAEVIDRYTFEKMQADILNAEECAYSEKNKHLGS